MTEQTAIESILHEERVFPPPPEFAAKAHVKSFEEYEKLYDEAAKDVPAFWAKQAETLDWYEKWHTVLEWNEPFAKWFVGGKINISYNCLDRHLSTWRKNKAAFIWEGEPGEQRTLTYLQLHREVCRFANVLKMLGVETGDRVALYMPLIPELAIAMQPGRDHWWHEIMETVDADCPAVELDSERPLFILYTSGTTGKPKGILHTTGGYLTQTAYTTKLIFDLKDEDIFWCTADIGWVTGHSYVVYGPLANGATVFMYEGAPNYPDFDRFWDMIERHRINTLYTAPTAIRAFIKWGEQYPLKHDLSSLRLIGTVGEPINPEAWMWYHEIIGKGKCPIIDTWWQTETGSAMISPLPGATPTVPGTATRPLPGIIVDVVTKAGKPVGDNEGGYLVIKHPWPSMLRTLWGDDERYKQAYWSEIPGVYFAGDGARRDERGYYWIMGRVDDVINVSGHRLGTAEVESALVSHEAVAEAAVVGRPDDLKGQAISAFVTLEGGRAGNDELKDALRAHVAKEIGALAKPDDIRFTDALPKTRSGKIMRRLLRELATTGSVAGDVTTLEDLSVIEKLREDEE